MSHRFAALSVLLCLFFSAQSSAELIAVDLMSAGDQLLTRDTRTGLDWLDLTATLGLSVGDITDDAGGWASRGFVYASTPQVQQLFLDADPSNPAVNVSAAKIPAALVLLDLLGVTNPGPSNNEFDVLGNGIEGVGEPGANLAYFADYGTDTAVTVGFLFVRDGTAPITFKDPMVGSFLVRTPASIPEPSTILLLTVGLMGMTVSRRAFDPS